MPRRNTIGGLVPPQDRQLHTGPAARRRRFALLAVVPAAAARGESRDKPHAIRHSVGGDEILQGSSTLQCNPARITSDVAELRTAPGRAPARGEPALEKLAARPEHGA